MFNMHFISLPVSVALTFIIRGSDVETILCQESIEKNNMNAKGLHILEYNFAIK